MDFCLSPYHHHQTACITQPSINMSNPDDLKYRFEDSSDIEMEDPSKPNCTLKLKQSSSLFNQPINASSAPSWHSLLFLSLHLWHPLWFLSLHCYCSSHSYQPTISSTFTTPETISFGRGHHRSWEENTLCQGRSKGS